MAFAHFHDQRVILIKQGHVLRQPALEVRLDLVVVRVEADPAVAGQDAMRVGVDDKRRQSAGIQKDRVGGFRPDSAPDAADGLYGSTLTARG